MNTEQFFEIAKILDNEYIGKEKTFSATFHKGFYYLTTNMCDSASLIRVYMDRQTNKVQKIMILRPDDDDYRLIMDASWPRIEKYLESLNEPPSISYEAAAALHIESTNESQKL